MIHKITKASGPIHVTLTCTCGWLRKVHRHQITAKMMRKRVEEARREHEFRAAEEARR